MTGKLIMVWGLRHRMLEKSRGIDVLTSVRSVNFLTPQYAFLNIFLRITLSKASLSFWNMTNEKFNSRFHRQPSGTWSWNQKVAWPLHFPYWRKLVPTTVRKRFYNVAFQHPCSTKLAWHTLTGPGAATYTRRKYSFYETSKYLVAFRI